MKGEQESPPESRRSDYRQLSLRLSRVSLLPMTVRSLCSPPNIVCDGTQVSGVLLSLSLSLSPSLPSSLVSFSLPLSSWVS